MPRKALVLHGQRFGRLQVVSRCGTRDRNSLWRCQCDCGQFIDVNGSHLKSGDVQSCGCLLREHCRKMAIVKHGHASDGKRSPEYRAWYSMKNRCNDKNNKRYSDYGGRGIVVCQSWSISFVNFLADMGPRPFGTSLDRINNDGDYEPTNCRWATFKEQANNRRPAKRYSAGTAAVSA